MNNGGKKLEAYKGFTVVAWITVITFTLFTYKLTLDLQQSVNTLSILVESQVQ